MVCCAGAAVVAAILFHILGVRRWSRRMLYWCVGVCFRCLGRSLCCRIDLWSAVSSG